MRALRSALPLGALLLMALPLPALAQHWPFPDAPTAAGSPAPAVRVFRLSGAGHDTPSPWDLFGTADDLVLPELLAALDRAAASPAVKALLVRFGPVDLSLSQREELANALHQVRKRGKRVIVHLESVDNADLMAASAADEVHLAPEGTVFLTGLRAEVSFYKDVLATLGLRADLEAQGRFKSAVEPMTRSGLSEPAREQLEALLDGLYATFLERIGRNRGLGRDAVAALVDVGLFTAEQAKARGLVDKLSYWRDLVDEVTARFGSAPALAWPVPTDTPEIGSVFGLLELLTRTDVPAQTGRPRIALLSAEGPIVSGRSQGGLMSDERVIASDDLLDAFEDIEQDASVKAVVLRIDSPGGSALASDILWRAVERLGKKRPVVVSMGSVAASGGYYLASAAQRIFALDTTVTGSIGVFGGKLVYGELLDKIGVQTTVLARGKHAGLFSPLTPFTDTERAVFRDTMAHTYDTFVNRVAAGRGMSYDAVHRVAQGRVWTGQQAVAAGLVDEIGGLPEALAAAARLAKLSLDDADIVLFPRQRSLLERLSGDPQRLLGPRLDLRALLAGLPAPVADRISAAANLLDQLLSREPALALLPFGLTLD